MTNSQKRTRTLTTKAMANYQEQVQSFESKLHKQWDVLQRIFQTDPSDYDELSFKHVKTQVFEHFGKYDSISSDYQKFLSNTRTQESEERLQKVSDLVVYNRKITNDFLSKLRAIKLETFSAGSERSSSSRLTSKSSQQAKLQAAMARAAFAEKEAELERKKVELEEQEKISAAVALRKLANLDIDIKVLQQKKEVAVAEAELETSNKQDELNEIPTADPKLRTALFIQQSSENVQQPNENVQQSNQNVQQSNQNVQQSSENIQPSNGNSQQLNPVAAEFVPNPQTTEPASHTVSDFTKYLLKKDVLTSRLQVFNDQPDTFQSWKVTFHSVIKEIGVSPEEEIDLLIKWLGVGSRKQAISLKAAYIHNPPVGLSLIWQRLDERFGAPENIYHTTVKKLESFPKLTAKDSAKLYDLSDILSEIEGLKTDPRFSVTLSYFDSAVGVNPIISKLPHNLQERWTVHATNYKRKNGVPFPPFCICSEFIREQSRIRNDPSFRYDILAERSPATSSSQVTGKKVISVRKTEVDQDDRCPIHKTNHTLENCRVFKAKSLEDRRKILSENKLCYRCLSNGHTARDCKCNIKCSVCSSKIHCTAMHIDRKATTTEGTHGGEARTTNSHRAGEDSMNKANVVSSCTEICGHQKSLGKSCAKIVLVNVYHVNDPNNSVKCYAIVDDQSNRSLAKPQLFSMLGITGESYDYLLKSCGGTVVATGRRTDQCVVQSLDKSVCYPIPTLIECAELPSDKEEICTADNARNFDHLLSIADCLPELDKNADILLLLGRDVAEAHHVFDQIVGPPRSPFAQRLGLGWVVIGELCLGQIHAQEVLNVYKTHVLEDGRTSLFKPCDGFSASVQDPIFVRTPDDNKVSLSRDDREFLQIMTSQFHKSPDGSWVAPLPLRSPRSRLPNNRSQAVKRANILARSLEKNVVKKQHFFEFMDKLLRRGHAELAPDLNQNEECWYLPIFGVYHPKKPDQVRVVFDSSAVFEGVSLNSVLLQGPDLVNSLHGVLIRFRRDKVAVMADIEQMFYSFSVEEKDRNFLRFLWHQDNDPSKPLVEYRMCKHVFGNSPSPAVATYGLRRSVESSDLDVQEYVTRDFYVDDGLTSQPSSEYAVNLLSRAQLELSDSKLRLHKIVSNCPEVMKAFPPDDLAKGLEDIDLECGDLPSQRSLGLVWNITSDTFTFKADMLVQPVTKRGILSTINSVFDPLGFVAPVILKGRLILRQVMSNNLEWDDDIPAYIAERWDSWLQNLKDLRMLGIPRSYFLVSLSQMSKVELHVFSDASINAISAVVYVLGQTKEGERHIGFVFGKSKLAPEKGHTVPRLELCGAVLAVDLFQSVSEHLYIKFDEVKFYTDSKIVLGYICNQSRRFYTYVSNRVQRILTVSNPQQWNYVPSGKNPADVGSRGVDVAQLIESSWLSGPHFLLQEAVTNSELFPLIEPEHDEEVRKDVAVKATVVLEQRLNSRLFERFSSWQSLIRAVSALRHIAESYHKNMQCKGWHICSCSKDVGFVQGSVSLVLQMVQHDAYEKEIKLLSEGSKLNQDSKILSLDPFIGDDGLFHVGGRLGRSKLSTQEKNPIIIPSKHPVAYLLAHHYHSCVHHQGRHFTEGALRSAGFWIIGAKRTVSRVISQCVVCRKLRGNFSEQKMSDLPSDRVEQLSSPFSYVGVDVFGPWHVVTRRTRGGQAESKRWAVLFTCLSIRAVHIEIIEDLSSSAFTNALRRFVAIRGKVKIFRSDRGTNFVGAIDNIKAEAINVEDEHTQNFLRKSGSVWLFNSPHSSHMGGAWERMIGIARRILEAMLLNVRTLTHEVLATLMAEVSAIINSRPIVPVSYDPEVPDVLSPSTLLTQKLECDQAPVGNINIQNLYLDQWKQVQYLASQFWVRWKKEYLQTLQSKRKWNQEKEPLKVNDVVLLRDLEVGRSCWPMGRISRVFPSADGRIRKVEVCIVKEGKKVFYTRPVVDLVLLVGQ